MTLTDLLASVPGRSWSYTNEGGANLILSYSGPPIPVLDGKVIRLRKKKKTGPAVVVGEVDLRFADEVIAPLLGEELVVKMERVQVGSGFLESLKFFMQEGKVRPREREEEDEVDQHAGYIVLTEDLVSGDGVLAIEIKPKWGFLPSPACLAPKSQEIKKKHCRFCTHSFMKESGNDMEAAKKRLQSGYCPLDLFSNDEVRLAKAVAALWEGWITTKGKANNLRVFLDGEKVSPTKDDVLETLGVRLKVLHTLDSQVPVDLSSALQAVLVPILRSSPLLARLKYLQSSLDPLDIEGLTSVLSSKSPSLPLQEPTIPEWISWKESWTTNELAPKDRDPVDLVLAYLLSATFKDCSIFIRLSPSHPPVLKVIDLDPKPVDRLGKYLALDQEIVDVFSSFLAHEGEVVRKCVV